MQSRDQLARLAETLGGIPVWGSLPGSLSHALGVRYGDVLLSVNGMRTANIDDYLDARNLRHDGADVVIFRDGQELTLSFDFKAAPATHPADLERFAQDLVEARVLPSERPSAPPEDDEN